MDGIPQALNFYARGAPEIRATAHFGGWLQRSDYRFREKTSI
jgi:hypothetical protein